MPSMEAMACDTALVTFDTGGCRDYARDGETALVARRRDVADLGQSANGWPWTRNSAQGLQGRAWPSSAQHSTGITPSGEATASDQKGDSLPTRPGRFSWFWLDTKELKSAPETRAGGSGGGADTHAGATHVIRCGIASGDQPWRFMVLQRVTAGYHESLFRTLRLRRAKKP